MSKDDLSRRQFLSGGVSAATTPVILQSDESSWLDSLFDWGDEDVDAPLAAGMADERSEVDPSLAAAYFALDTGAVYEPSDDYSEWRQIDTTGESPAFESINTKQAVLSDQGSQPSVESGSRVLYAKGSNGNVYKVNPDGTEEQLGGGGGLQDGEDFDGQETSDFTNLNSIDTERVQTASRASTIVVWKDGNGTIYADGPKTAIDSGTDFATVLESAISNLPSAGGQIYIAEGSYTVSSTININRDDVHIFGSGWGTELVAENSLNTTMIQIGDGGTTEVRRVFLSNFAIDGNKANQTAGNAIHTNKAVWFVRLNNLRIENAYSAGVLLTSDSTYFNVWNVIDRCKIKACDGHGIEMVGSKTRDHFINNCSIRDNGLDGLNATNASHNWHHVYQNGFLSNRTGVRFSGDYCNFEGNHFEFNGERGVFVNGGTKSVVSNNTFRSNSQASLGSYDEILANGSRTAIHGNAGSAKDSNYAINKTSGDYDTVIGNSFAYPGYNNQGGSNSDFTHNV